MITAKQIFGIGLALLFTVGLFRSIGLILYYLGLPDTYYILMGKKRVDYAIGGCFVLFVLLALIYVGLSIAEVF